MSREVEALVANVLDSYRVALNVGKSRGVAEGNNVTVWRTVDVRDPATGEDLGSVRLDKLKMSVSFVEDKYCVASVRVTNTLGLPAAFGARKRISGGGASSRSDEFVSIHEGDEATIYVEDEVVDS